MNKKKKINIASRTTYKMKRYLHKMDEGIYLWKMIVGTLIFALAFALVLRWIFM
jgi:hypothetical protein